LYPEPDTPEAAEAKKAVLGKATSGAANILGSGSVDSKAGGDRSSIRLRPLDAEIIRAVHSVCPRTIVAVVTAGAVIMEEWRAHAPGLLLSWYSGAEGGHALADVLLGKCDVSGRLPYSIPTTEEHLPEFDMEAEKVTYDKWHGQRLLDQKGWKAAFPLGFGLSYTSFEIGGLEVETKGADEEEFNVTLTVANTGARAGRYIAQVYGQPKGAGEDFPSRVLLGFAPVNLEKGEKKKVSVSASTRPLKRWVKGRGFEWAGKSVVVEVGGFSGDEKALREEVSCEKLT
jgi:beta-glucosidase